MNYTSLVPRPPHPAFVACSMKSGEKARKDLSHDAYHCSDIRYVLKLATIGPVAIRLTGQTEQKNERNSGKEE